MNWLPRWRRRAARSLPRRRAMLASLPVRRQFRSARCRTTPTPPPFKPHKEEYMSHPNERSLARRRTIGLLVAGAAGIAAAGLPSIAAAQARPLLRIGYQKYGTLTLLKGRGTLEKRLAAKGIDVKWTEF